MDVSVRSLSLSASNSSPSAETGIEAEAQFDAEATAEATAEAEATAADAHERVPTFAQKMFSAFPGFGHQKDASRSRSRSRSRERVDDGSDQFNTVMAGTSVNTASGGIKTDRFTASTDESTRDVKGGADHKKAKVVVDESQADNPMDLDFGNLDRGAQTSLSTAATAIQKGTYTSPVGKNLKR